MARCLPGGRRDCVRQDFGSVDADSKGDGAMKLTATIDVLIEAKLFMYCPVCHATATVSTEAARASDMFLANCQACGWNGGIGIRSPDQLSNLTGFVRVVE